MHRLGGADIVSPAYSRRTCRSIRETRMRAQRKKNQLAPAADHLNGNNQSRSKEGAALPPDGYKRKYADIARAMCKVGAKGP